MSETVTARRFSLENAAAWALIATTLVAAIILIPSVVIPFIQTKVFILAGGAIVTLALFILARLSRGNVIFPPLALVGALWLPVLAYLLSALFAGGGFSTGLWGSALEADTLGFILTGAFLGTLAALALRRLEHYRSFLVAGLAALGLIVVAQLLILVVGQIVPDTVSPALSIIGSYGDLATILGLGVVGSLLTLRFLEVAPRTRMALLIGSALALFLIAVANSSLVWTLLALVSLGLFVESVMKRGSHSGDADLAGMSVVSEHENDMENESSARSLALPLGVLAVSLFFLIGGTLGNALASGLGVNVLNVRPSWQATLDVGSKVYGASPVFGSGPGSFGGEWLKYRDASLNSTVFWNVDFSSGIGFLPTSFVTTGALGLLAWLGLAGLFLFFGLRMLLLRAPSDPFARYVAILTFVGSTYLFAIATFDLPGTVVLALMFVLMGIFASTMRYAEGRWQWGVVFAKAPRIGFVIVFGLTLLLLASIVAAYSLVGHYLAQVNLARTSAALSRGDLTAASAAAEASIAFAPSAVAYQAQAQIAQARMAEVASSETLSQTEAQQAFQAALSAGINAALTATRVDPTNYQSWVVLGNLYASAVPTQGAYDNAKTSYQKAVELNPTNPSILYVIAQLEIANEDTKAAKESLTSAIALKQDYTQAILLLSQLEVQDGNLKEALTAAEAAAYFTPTDANVLFQVGILRAASDDFSGSATALGAAIAANPQFANAYYFLAAVYAKQGNYAEALKAAQAAADLSTENATALESVIASLKDGKNPFPANLLSASPTPQ